MTNRTDLDECFAKIEIIKQLLGPETFDLKKILIELETKKKLLMKFKPRDYATILKGLESGVFIHPGVFEEKKEIITVNPLPSSVTPIPVKKEEKPKINKENVSLKKELQLAKDKLVSLEALEELKKGKEAEIIKESIK
ncbi:hypothetical protein LCGC14_0860530 [marine sediment metagenome]|uniref:Uncharacterized protein n=1 Tax=marine sediment metagenome TaxID=412755 RepID=A0A0F9PSZ9_9ZZZZ